MSGQQQQDPGQHHGHGPDHTHSHAGAHDHQPPHLVDANRTYFDEQAATYDSRHAKMLERITAELRSRLDFIGVDWADDDEDEDEARKHDDGTKPKKQVRMLDYACGTGMMSRALAPYVTQIVGIDLSANMVATYNARVKNQGLAEDEMYAVQGNLASHSDPDPPALSGPEFRDFDLAVVGGGFHHFDDPGLAAVRLAERLNPGGVLLIWDFLAHGDAGDGEGKCGGGAGAEGEKFSGGGSHTITHHGFTEDGIRLLYERAGVAGDFRVANLGSGLMLAGHGAPEAENLRRQVFLARGQKTT